MVAENLADNNTNFIKTSRNWIKIVDLQKVISCKNF